MSWTLEGALKTRWSSSTEFGRPVFGLYVVNGSDVEFMIVFRGPSNIPLYFMDLPIGSMTFWAYQGRM